MRVLYFCMMLVAMYIFYCVVIAKQQNITFLNPKPQSRHLHFCMMLIAMYAFYCVHIAFLYGVSSNVHTMLCGYCKATKYYNLECQTLMKVMHLCLMLVLVYVFYYVTMH
jgi:hypothetical protein